MQSLIDIFRHLFVAENGKDQVEVKCIDAEVATCQALPFAMSQQATNPATSADASYPGRIRHYRINTKKEISKTKLAQTLVHALKEAKSKDLQAEDYYICPVCGNLMETEDADDFRCFGDDTHYCHCKTCNYSRGLGGTMPLKQTPLKSLYPRYDEKKETALLALCKKTIRGGQSVWRMGNHVFILSPNGSKYLLNDIFELSCF